MNISGVLAFAKEQGYVDAEPRGNWNGYDVFKPVSERDNTGLTVGLPYVILAKGDEVRISGGLETLEWMSDWEHNHEHELVTA